MKPEPRFEVGDAVVVVGAQVRTQYNGRRAIVTGRKFIWKWSSGHKESWGYQLDILLGIPEAAGFPVDEMYLRPAPPDRTEVFDASIWQPRKVEA